MCLCVCATAAIPSSCTSPRPSSCTSPPVSGPRARSRPVPVFATWVRSSLNGLVFRLQKLPSAAYGRRKVLRRRTGPGRCRGWGPGPRTPGPGAMVRAPGLFYPGLGPTWPGTRAGSPGPRPGSRCRQDLAWAHEDDLVINPPAAPLPKSKFARSKEKMKVMTDGGDMWRTVSHRGSKRRRWGEYGAEAEVLEQF